MRSRSPRAQRAEAFAACNILNRMTDLGGPVSERLDVAVMRKLLQAIWIMVRTKSSFDAVKFTTAELSA